MDEKQKQFILVPWDFSEVSKYALDHAVRFAKVIDGNIALINIIKKTKEAEEVEQKMEVVAEETEKRYNIRPEVIIKEGSIFKTITTTADELSAVILFMGTHGIKGMQKYTGSWALKVIAGTEAPFIVVQESPKHEQFKDVIFPIDFRTENKEKLRWANFLSKFYNTKIHLCKSENFTDELLKRKAKSNFIYSRNYLMERGIDFEVVNLNPKKNFTDETIDYAKKINASLILIMTTKDISFQDYVLGAEEQKIIANRAKIPVMCINPRDVKKGGGYFTA